MNIGIGTKIYLLLSTLEAKHNLLWADGLHRQVLMAVLAAEGTGLRLTNQHIVDLNLSSRSTTYRKISDLKQSGFYLRFGMIISVILQLAQLQSVCLQQQITN